MAWTPPADWANLEVVTNTKLNAQVRDNMRELWHRVAYVEATATVSNTTATEAAPLFVLSSGAVTYGGFPVMIEVFAPRMFGVGANLFDDTTNLGRLTHAAAGMSVLGWSARRYLTPAAGSHTYRIGTWQTGGTSNGIDAGAGGVDGGGVGLLMPAYIAVWEKGGA
jgi:hypothetical protein